MTHEEREKTLAEIRSTLRHCLDDEFYAEKLRDNYRGWLEFLLSELERKEDEIAFWQKAAETQKENNLAILEQNRKLIEGLRKLAKTNAENISEIREWKAKQNDPEVIDLDWYNYVARNILREIGVAVDE